MIRLQTYPHVVKGLRAHYAALWLCTIIHSMLKIGEPHIAGTIDAIADIAKGKKPKIKLSEAVNTEIVCSVCQ